MLRHTVSKIGIYSLLYIMTYCSAAAQNINVGDSITRMGHARDKKREFLSKVFNQHHWIYYNNFC